MPPLLYVNVRRAKLGPFNLDSISNSPIQFNTYVQLKLHNLTINTLPVKGLNPNWEQNFLFQTAGHETGLLVELWNKGALWNKLLGCIWIPLDSVFWPISSEQQLAAAAVEDNNNSLSLVGVGGNPDGFLQGTWYFLDTDVLYDDRNHILGTSRSTEHMLLISCHFEPSINELGVVDQCLLNPQQQQLQNDTVNINNNNNNNNNNQSLNLQPPLTATSTPTRLRSPYLLDPKSAALAQLAVAEADRTGSSPTVATVSNVPTTSNLYKQTIENQQQQLMNHLISSSENERTDQTQTSTESDSQGEEQLGELASRLRTKRGLNLLDELIMANNQAAVLLVDQLCALDDSDDSDGGGVLDDEQINESSEDDLLLLDGLKIRDLEQLLQMVSIEHLNDKQLLTAAAFEEALCQHAKRKALTRYLRKRRQMKHLMMSASASVLESGLEWDQLDLLSNTLTKHELQIQKLQQAQLPTLMFNQAAVANQLLVSNSPQPCTYVQQQINNVQRSGSTTPKLTYYGDIYTSSGTTSSAVAAHLAASGISAIPLNQTTTLNQQQLAANQQQQQQQLTTNRKLPQMPSSASCLIAGTVPSPFQNLSSPTNLQQQQLNILSTNQLDPAISPNRNQQHLISPKRYSNLDSKSTYQQQQQAYDDYIDDDQMMILEEEEDEDLLDELKYAEDENDELLDYEDENSWQQQQQQKMSSSKKRSLDAKQAMIGYGSRRLPQINQTNAPRPHRKLPHISDT